MSARDIAATALLVAGMAFMLLGAIGIARFPDLFTRLHPAGKSETMGAALVMLSLAVDGGWSLLMAKVLLVQVFILFGTPASAHAIGRAAFIAHLRPWVRERAEDR